MRPALPVPLIVLLFASPVFSQSTSLNDPFRAITAQAQKHKQPENPICCLKPLTPSEPVDDGVLLSFEEWKMKQLGTQQASAARADEQEAASRAATAVANEGNAGNGESSNASESTISTTEDSTGVAGSAEPNSQERVNFSPSKAPLTDRFNYASLDCSARVHTSHRSAKSPSSILSSKRDRYMLSPCDTPKENQHVVVELCDDIRIDTIQLANFEFFSGVFKDFTVSVAKTYTNDPDTWSMVQTYRAKNIRGVQTFRPPDDLLDFYRFIRIDFHSHYGNEYYCPVSLLRVYGLTHLEEWKWDIWESESRAKQAELQKRRQLPLSTIAAPTPTAAPVINDIPGSISKPHSENSVDSTVASLQDASQQSSTFSSPTSLPSSSSSPSTTEYRIPFTPYSEAKDLNHPSVYSTNPSNTITQDTHDSNFQQRPTDTYVLLSVSTHIPNPSNTEDNVSNIPPPITQDTATTETNHPLSMPLSTSIQSQQQTPSHTTHTAHSSHSGNSQSSPPETSVVFVSSESPPVAIIPVTPVHPTAKGGESIYRTILNRLTEVEINQTLYMRYIEQQNLVIRDVMKRLVEDVGRLEGITRMHTLTYQRNLDGWLKQKSQLEMEYVDLAMRVELLTEEIVLEKRLGVAQLCLLLAVLVFMGLTRGSRSEALIDRSSNPLNRSVRQWGERHLKLNNSWTDRFKTKLSIDVQRASSGIGSASTGSRSHTMSPVKTPKSFSRPKLVSAKTYPIQPPLRRQEYEEGIQFPSTSKYPFNEMNVNTAPAYTDIFPRMRTRTLSNSNPRSRAPSLRSTPANRRTHHQRPNTPVTTAFRPQMLQRSSSHHGASGSLSGMLPLSASWGVPKSAKKWARSAHLHVVGTVKRPRRKSIENAKPMGAVDPEKGGEWEKDVVFTPLKAEFGSQTRLGKEKDHDTHHDGDGVPTFPDSSETHALKNCESSSFENSLLLRPSGDPTQGDEGDVWVDTDSVDGSELDAEHYPSVKDANGGSVSVEKYGFSRIS